MKRAAETAAPARAPHARIDFAIAMQNEMAEARDIGRVRWTPSGT
jgi:hypothetical protein